MYTICATTLDIDEVEPESTTKYFTSLDEMISWINETEQTIVASQFITEFLQWIIIVKNPIEYLTNIELTSFEGANEGQSPEGSYAN